MSHFVVAVITEKVSDVKHALQPYHEYECTNIEDQYVKNVDRTAEALEEYAKAKVVRLRAPDGTLHKQFTEEGEWKPEFSQPSTDALDVRLKRRVEFIPAGYTRVEIPASEVESEAEWISDYYGWPIVGQGKDEKYGRIELNPDGSVAKCIDRTNPDARWDWWVNGDRFDDELEGSGS